MRKIFYITYIALLFFITPANSASLELLNKACLIWKNNNFDQSNITDRSELGNSLVCAVYMAAWVDAANFNCFWSKQLEDTNIINPLAPISFGSFNNLSAKQLAQMTINYAQTHTEDWDKNPAGLWYNIIPNDVAKCEAP